MIRVIVALRKQIICKQESLAAFLIVYHSYVCVVIIVVASEATDTSLTVGIFVVKWTPLLWRLAASSKSDAMDRFFSRYTQMISNKLVNYILWSDNT